MADLYLADRRYWFAAGWDWRGVVATLVGAVLAVGGAYSNPGGGPFPEDGLIPFLKPLYDYSWAVGLVAGLLIYLGLAAMSPARRPEPVASPAG